MVKPRTKGWKKDLREEIEEKQESLTNAKEDILLREQFIAEEEKRLTIADNEIATLTAKMEARAEKKHGQAGETAYN